MKKAPGWMSALVVALAAPLAAAQQFGTITFPTSGAPEAQSHFLTGVKALHNFQFPEAEAAFRQAQRLDEDFALAYWGEAMSHNHPLWGEQDVEAAKKALERLAPTHEARLAKAALPKEKALLEALQILYFSPGEKQDRDAAYAAKMASLYDKWPDDHEIATFYALALLGSIDYQNDRSYRKQALAASIAQTVFEQNPLHPGAAHFIIHAFDDPDHAPLGLKAARAYAKIAPASAHALHMPSHIFVQRGMWQDVIDSNEVSYKAAVALNKRLKLPEGRADFHALSWLAYGHLMLGHFDEAAGHVRLAGEALERNPDSWSVREGYASMRARYILESGRWERLSLDERENSSGSASHRGMACAPGSEAGSGTWTFIVGVSAAKLKDFATAEVAMAKLGEMHEEAAKKNEVRLIKPLEMQQKQLAAYIQHARGATQEALKLAKAAVEIEQTMPTPAGPPYPIKPAFELYGELLLDAGQANEAAAAFEQALLLTPNRRPSVLGLAQAKKAGTRFAATNAQ